MQHASNQERHTHYYLENSMKQYLIYILSLGIGDTIILHAMSRNPVSWENRLQRMAYAQHNDSNSNRESRNKKIYVGIATGGILGTSAAIYGACTENPALYICGLTTILISRISLGTFWYVTDYATRHHRSHQPPSPTLFNSMQSNDTLSRLQQIIPAHPQNTPVSLPGTVEPEPITQ